MKKLLLVAGIVLSLPLHAVEVVVRCPEGKLQMVHVEDHESFHNVISILQDVHGQKGEYLLDFMAKDPLDYHAATAKSRHYLQAVTASERSDINFIINTLGMSSLAKVTKSKSSLKKAGDRVDHVHPLRFLLTIFSDEPMKASIHAMQGRSWIWSEFINNLKDTFEEEAVRGTLSKDYVVDFSQKLGLNPDTVNTYVQQHSWTGLVDYMISSIPRNADHGRYNM